MAKEAPAPLAAAFVLMLLWLGMLLGVSFLATPVKFLAPTLSLPAALDVGRQTFAVFNKVEWAFVLTLLLVTALGVRRPGALAALAILIVALGLETGWLLPALDARVGRVIAGEVLQPSRIHIAYVLADGAKSLALGIGAFAIGRALILSLAPPR